MAIQVNGQVIPDAAIQFEMERLIRFYSQHMGPDQIRGQFPALRRKAVEQAVGAKLLIDEAVRLGVEMPDERVEERIQQMRNEVGSEERMQELLKQQGMTMDMLRDSIKRGGRVDVLVEQVATDVPEPTEAEIKDHFTQHRAEYRKPERAAAQHILLAVDADASDEEKETARSRLTEIREKIDEGANFADLAAAHSDCPSGKQAGGSLGWFGRGMMVPEFDQVVFSMEVGELSEIIETQFGYHLIHKTGQEDAADADYDDARDRVRDFVRHARRGAAITAYVEELKAKAEVEGLEEYLAQLDKTGK